MISAFEGNGEAIELTPMQKRLAAERQAAKKVEKPKRQRRRASQNIGADYTAQKTDVQVKVRKRRYLHIFIVRLSRQVHLFGERNRAERFASRSGSKVRHVKGDDVQIRVQANEVVYLHSVSINSVRRFGRHLTIKLGDVAKKRCQPRAYTHQQLCQLAQRLQFSGNTVGDLATPGAVKSLLDMAGVAYLNSEVNAIVAFFSEFKSTENWAPIYVRRTAKTQRFLPGIDMLARRTQRSKRCKRIV